ncbi:MAG: glycosyltransferase family 39 protein, partial [Acidobacteriota bacterium]
VILAVPVAFLGRLGRGDVRTCLLTLLAVASLAQAAGPDLWRFLTSSEVRVWNVYHYYLGAKYFDELGYHDLYDATLVADRESGDYWRRIERVRNLRTYQVESREVGQARYRPLEHFSEERWRAFRDDVVALRDQLPARSWRGIFTDRGYNPSPFWTVVGEALAGRFAASSLWALKLLCGLDLLILGATFVFVRRTFDPRAAVLAVLFFTLAPFNNARLIGGFLQFDWLAAVTAGLCFVRRGRSWPAAACFAYATLARVFPAVLVASALVPAAWRWIRDGRLPRRVWIFFPACALFGLLGLGLGTFTGHGVAAWGEFATNLHAHNHDHLYGQRRVGLQHVFTHDLRSFALDEGKGQRRELFAQQKGLYSATALVLVLGYLLVAHRRSFPDALLFGLVPFFVLAVSSRYYWALLALLPLLARPGPSGARRGRWLSLAQATLLAAYYAFTFWRPERYAAYSMLNMLLALFFLVLLALYSSRDLMVARRRAGAAPPWHRSTALKVFFFVGLFVVLCYLRMPLEQYPIRDVDESVSALIAASWLEGGVPYRDAIDQRGPLTYVIYALVFAVGGIHNMAAVHWALLLLILGAAWLLFDFSRQLRPGPAGAAMAYSAAFFFVLSTYTYRRSQMLAFHTEWPMMLCNLAAMMALWQGLERRRPWRLVLAGALYAGGFLSKQPGLFDAVAGGLFVLLWQGCRGRLFRLETLGHAALLAAGFFAILLATAGYFLAAGAWADVYLYYWSYNVEHYAKIVGWDDRLRGLDPFAHRRHYLTANPLLFVAALQQSVIALWGLLRHRRVDARLLLVLWCLFAYFGASYSGRNFGHYFIQLIPAACLLAAWAVVDAWRALGPSRQLHRWLPDLAQVGRGLLVASVLVGLAMPLARFSDDLAWPNLHRPARIDPVRQGALDVIAERTSTSDTIFVWGYYPELYVLSGRRPASRYSNTNYLTGMLPWENHQPGVDTSEHIVEGAWDILFHELDATRPRLVLDTAPGNHRYYSKYPVAKFPRFADYLARHYQLIDPVRDRQGNVAIAVWSRRP